MSRFHNYLRNAKMAKDFLISAQAQAQRGETQKAIGTTIVAMNWMITAMTNAASIGFKVKPKAPRRKTGGK